MALWIPAGKTEIYADGGNLVDCATCPCEELIDTPCSTTDLPTTLVLTVISKGSGDTYSDCLTLGDINLVWDSGDMAWKGTQPDSGAGGCDDIEWSLLCDGSACADFNLQGLMGATLIVDDNPNTCDDDPFNLYFVLNVSPDIEYEIEINLP